MGDLVEDLSAAFAKAKIPLKGDRKTSLFRIHRDVRFAKDKSPYKTNVGAVLTRGGGKNDPGLFYVHVAIDGCFTAAGFYDLEPDKLARMRGAIVRTPKTWKAMLAKLAKTGLTPSDEYAMKRPPRGFEGVEDAEIAAVLRLKSIICRRPIPDDRLADAGPRRRPRNLRQGRPAAAPVRLGRRHRFAVRRGYVVFGWRRVAGNVMMRVGPNGRF